MTNDFLDSAHGLANFRKMVSSTRLVRWVALTNHERHLVFDLNCEESIRYFLQTVKNQSRITLKEFFLPGDSGKIYDVKGNVYLGQLWLWFASGSWLMVCMITRSKIG